jgi:chromosomal replication initiation ATPase DnaA
MVYNAGQYQVRKELEVQEESILSRVVQPNLTMQQVNDGAAYYKTSTKDMRKIIRGPQIENEVCKIAMYLCQASAAAKLRDIADYFNLNHA